MKMCLNFLIPFEIIHYELSSKMILKKEAENDERRF